MAKTKLPPSIERQQERLAKAATWKDRVEKILEKRRKKNPAYSIAELCRTYEWDPAWLHRLYNQQVVPSQKTVDAIEAALKKERV